MRFEIVNPSDPYTMEAPDMEVAAVACCLLGSGKYGLTGLGEDSAESVPIFLLGGHDEWFVEKFGMSYADTVAHCLEHRGKQLAESLDSVTLMRGERSSLNDIGRRARKYAELVREKAAENP